LSAPATDDERRALLSATVAELEARIGRPWSNFDSLPACPECGTPLSRGRVAGVLCMESGGGLRRPHARRLAAWEKTLVAA
jgi:hypothetical protein